MIAGMAHDLDHITAQTDCPGCGETIRPIDDTPIGRVQKLIDEAGC